MFICMFIVVMFIICSSLFYKYVYLVKQRTEINNVYIKLYNHIKRKKVINSLCREMRVCLSAKELLIVYGHFHSQKPSNKINKEFFDNKCFIGGIYWWYYHTLNKDLNYEYTHQRKLFILKMIKITTK